MKRIILSAALAAICSLTWAQEREELFPFGNMDQWVKREIKESAIIGGAQKDIYAVGPTQTIKGDLRPAMAAIAPVWTRTWRA